MKPDHYISELLYTSDCVIIPDLGGFVTNLKGSVVNISLNTFFPPSRNIAFNSSLRNNDGLLAFHISRREGISYASALEQIRNYASECLLRLKSGEKIELFEIGSLFMDHESNIQFEPDPHVNYRMDAFGLTAIHSPAIQRENAPSIILSGKNKRRAKIKKLSPWNILEIVPAAAVLVLLLASPGTVQNLNRSLGSVIPFTSIGMDNHSDHTTVSTQPIPAKSDKTQAEDGNTDSAVTADLLKDPLDTAQVPAEVNTTVSQSENEATNVNAVTKKADELKVAESKPETSNTISGKSYYVIGGCFSVKENADKFLSEAKAKGFDATIIGLNAKGMTMVSLAKENDITAAGKQLDSIRQQFDKAVWLYSK